MRNDDFGHDDYRSGYLDYEEINRIVAQKMTGCILCTYVNNVDTFILSIMKFFSNIL